MSQPVRLLAGVIAAVLLVAAGWYAARLFLDDDGGYQLAGEGLRQLPPFRFEDVDGEPHASSEWQGKALVVNFWATWCPPCREEMPLFIEMQEQYRAQGVQFIGIAIDDPDLVRDFSDVYGINFPVLIGGPEAIQLANSLGNRFDSLPFTAIFDHQGNTRYVQAGQMTRTILEERLQEL